MSTKYKLVASIAVTMLVVCVFMVMLTNSLTMSQRAKIDSAGQALPVQASLQSYCETALKQNESTCLTWAQDIVANQFQAAESCHSAFDWFIATDAFANCLRVEGIIASK